MEEEDGTACVSEVQEASTGDRKRSRDDLNDSSSNQNVEKMSSPHRKSSRNNNNDNDSNSRSNSVDDQQQQQEGDSEEGETEDYGDEEEEDQYGNYSDEEADGEFHEDEQEEEDYQPKPPDETKANALPFHRLVQRLEKLWQFRRQGKKVSQADKLKSLFTARLKAYFGKESSIFPFLRLIMPEMDNVRGHLGMKEKAIAMAWASAMGFSKKSAPYQKLLKFSDPEFAGPKAQGDLSLCIEEVLNDRLPFKESKVTVGQMNELLDDLAKIKRGQFDDAEERSKDENNAIKDDRNDISPKQEETASSSNRFSSALKSRKPNTAMKKHELRKKWVERLIALKLTVSFFLNR